MNDLTSFLSTIEQVRIGALLLSSLATSNLRAVLLRYYEPRYCEPEHFGPIVAKSVASFLTNEYFYSSAWFRDQDVHTAGACVVHAADGEFAPLVHVARQRDRGWMICWPDEVALPPRYFEQRVIEEVRVEVGLAEIPLRRMGGAS